MTPSRFPAVGRVADRPSCRRARAFAADVADEIAAVAGLVAACLSVLIVAACEPLGAWLLTLSNGARP